jgi:endoglycosylceramidase
VNPTNQLFTDEYGRVRIFHGVNAVYKIPPWVPNTSDWDPQLSLSSKDVEDLYNWGFNAVRLGVMWPGLEPVKGQYNMTYIGEIQKIVNSLGTKGIHTLLDLHQDLLSRKFCGEGIPDWAVNTDTWTLPFPVPVGLPMKLDPTTGYPNLTECLERQFAEYYFADKVGNAFQNLYDNTSNIQTSLLLFWQQVAKVFKASDTVLGYELINEPWAGDIYRHPSLLEPKVADRINLMPMYKKLHAGIRQIDDTHMIFFENAVSDVTVINGFDEGPGGKAYNDRQVFSYHIYCAPTDPDGNPQNVIECDTVDDVIYAGDLENIKRLGCGSMMTEFGAMGNVTSAVENLELLTSVADLFLQSWTYWQYKLFNDITTSGPSESFYIGKDLEISKVKALSRTYAQAISGVPIHMAFQPSNSHFVLSYAVDTSINQPTEIYLNEHLYYPNGFTVTLNPSAAASWKQVETNRIQVMASSSAKSASILTVTITPK